MPMMTGRGGGANWRMRRRHKIREGGDGGTVKVEGVWGRKG